MKSIEFAELIGIVLGDGNVYEYVKGKGIANYSIRIAGDAVKDLEYHTFIFRLCLQLFNYKSRLYFHSTRREIISHIYGKKYVELFKTQGILPGNKIKNKSTIPLWIFENEDYLKACIRGLIDTDGSIYRMGKWNQMCFKKHNLTLLEDFRRGLLILGYTPSKITLNKVYISKRREIQRYHEEIGFNNPKHEHRYLKFVNV